jgi:hypothetical protein
LNRLIESTAEHGRSQNVPGAVDRAAPDCGDGRDRQRAGGAPAKECADPAIGAVQIGRAWYWRTATRRYCLTLQTDLFGSLVLIQSWSAIHNRRGGSRQQPVADLDTAVPAIQKIFARRRQHRYQPVVPVVHWNAWLRAR